MARGLWLFIYAGTLFGYHWNSRAVAIRRVAWVMGALSGVCWLSLDPAVRLAALGPALLWALYFGWHQRPLLASLFTPDGHAASAPGWRAGAWHKPATIALTWAWVTVWLPLPAHRWDTAVFPFMERAAFIFALALAYDWHDRAVDHGMRLHTLALQLGPRRTLRLMDTAWIGASIFVVASAVAGTYPWQVAAALVAHLALSRLFLKAMLCHGWALGWQKVAIDACMLAQGGMMLGACPNAL
ncbi:MAG: hypothetical protein SFV52_12245 [Saprospiraceae bacterium]|nr:hypothetical protein [Saprospiraceae bacterium]